jgi:hypothetical protein
MSNPEIDNYVKSKEDEYKELLEFLARNVSFSWDAADSHNFHISAYCNTQNKNWEAFLSIRQKLEQRNESIKEYNLYLKLKEKYENV